jgi:hypothetical protein
MTMAKKGTLPTPQASDSKRGAIGMSDRGKIASLTESLSGQALSDETHLSPHFVEWLMGVPEDWTTTNTPSACTSSETASSRKPPHEPGKCSQDAYLAPLDFRITKG